MNVAQLQIQLNRIEVLPPVTQQKQAHITRTIVESVRWKEAVAVFGVFNSNNKEEGIQEEEKRERINKIRSLLLLLLLLLLLGGQVST